MIVEDRAGHGPDALRAVTADLMARANQTSGVTRVFTMFETSTPQIYLDIDRTKAQLLGVNVQDVFNALQVYIGSVYVNDFNLFGRTYRVTAQARDEDRRNIADVLKIRVRNSSGDTVPLGSFTTVRDIAGPFRVPHYNLYPAAELDGEPRARIFARAGHRHHGQARGRDAAGRLRRRLDVARLPADQGRQHGDVRLHPRGGVRVPGAGRAVRKPDAAACGHYDRADVSGGRDFRRHPARNGQQHPYPGRVRGADRACRQERDPDRGIRAPARGSGVAAAGMRRWRRRGCGCGRS